MAAGGRLLDKAIGSIGGTSEFQRKSQQYRRNLAYIEDSKEELLKRYDENWIAVYNVNVVAHSRKIKEVLGKTKELNLPLDEIVIVFISSRKVTTLFHRCE